MPGQAGDGGRGGVRVSLAKCTPGARVSGTSGLQNQGAFHKDGGPHLPWVPGLGHAWGINAGGSPPTCTV